MSGCGKFVCGMRRFDKHKVHVADVPSNPGLHNENEKRLADMMKLRAEQDQGIFTAPVSVPPVGPPNDSRRTTQ